MKFSIAKSPKAKEMELCTLEKFKQYTQSGNTIDLCRRIAEVETYLTLHSDEKDSEEYKAKEQEKSRLKAMLPVITWQAYFPNGKRKSSEAESSGLFMIDVDHVENARALYEELILGGDKDWGIVYAGMTPSTHGLRVVARLIEGTTTLEENQKILAEKLGLEIDEVCKDFARCSFMVPEDYIFFFDESIFTEEPKYTLLNSAEAKQSTVVAPAPKQEIDQREGLFGGQIDYNGIELPKICEEWFEETGGEPQQGERNTKLYRLATRLRYICDFNEAIMLKVMPRYGLGEDEMRTLIHSANASVRSSQIPKDFADLLARLMKEKVLQDDVFDAVSEEEFAEVNDVNKLPAMPPIFRQFVDIAPEDFKAATALCLLPILGSLGSKLRSTYWDQKVHSPSFNVSLEAPQGSGKSFMKWLSDYCLESMKQHDQEQRQKEREYQEKVKEMKLLNVKVTKKDKDEVLGQKPETLIRFVPATMSITQLLIRMNNAKGLHLFAIAEEIDTVYKAFKRGLSSYSDALRTAFDNGEYGQDYASENSFSGIVKLYYNTLFSGTPKAMRRFYPDMEDGLVSRVLFVTFPDQFGKPMPVWKEFSEKDKLKVDMNLERLNQISLEGDAVQDDHLMNLDWLNEALKKWVLKQQSFAIKTKDRSRDTFCRRSAVVGFRAGMLAWFLYGEKRTPAISKNVVSFAIWVANYMLHQQVSRFNMGEEKKNTLGFSELYEALPDNFTQGQLAQQIQVMGVTSPVRTVLYRWAKQGVVKKAGKNVIKVKNNLI